MGDIQDPFTGEIFRHRYNIPTSFAEAKSYEDQIRCLLQLLCNNYWQWATKKELNDVVAQLAATIQAGDDRLDAELRKQVTRLETLIKRSQKTAVIYDPTTGKYSDSQIAMNNVVRNLAVFSATVEQMAIKTCDEAAKENVITWAMIGNCAIFGASQPRPISIDQSQRS